MMTSWLEGVEAGSVIDGLSFICLDEAGRPATPGTQGRLKVSWMKGGKKMTLSDDPLPLPPIQASTGALNAVLLYSVACVNAGAAKCTACPNHSKFFGLEVVSGSILQGLVKSA